MQRKTGLVGLLLLFTSLAIAETPTRRAFVRWLQASNSADRTKLTAFWNTYNPEWAQIDRELHLRKESGGFTLVKIESDDGTKLEAIVADAGELFLGVVLDLKSVDPPKIGSVAVHGTPTQDGLVTPFSSDRELVTGVKARVDSLAASDQFAGTVIVERQGTVLLKGSWGEADRAVHRKVVLDTQFRIGSMNKMFTAVAALQLIEQNKLALEGKVGDY
jgi:hypothetical protein